MATSSNNDNLLCLSSLAAHASSDKQCVQLIQSHCSYYHYLCDGIDDRGWGCGYRSLQSLCSWVVKYQPNSATPPPVPPISVSLSPVPPMCHHVPTINEIQSCLVEVEDKPSSFVGSKEWIGSVESSIVLDHLFGVSCKILHVPSGSKVADQLDVLNRHFKHVGSPVMIGGDVDGASKTLIGMSLEENHLQEPQFLIADPHYHGVSDAATVLSGGYVSWHSMKLFRSDSFYNYCLPQSPM